MSDLENLKRNAGIREADQPKMFKLKWINSGFKTDMGM